MESQTTGDYPQIHRIRWAKHNPAFYLSAPLLFPLLFLGVTAGRFSVKKSNKIIQDLVKRIRDYEASQERLMTHTYTKGERIGDQDIEEDRITLASVESKDGVVRGTVSYYPMKEGDGWSAYGSPGVETPPKICVTLDYAPQEKNEKNDAEYSGLSKLVKKYFGSSEIKERSDVFDSPARRFLTRASKEVLNRLFKQRV